MYLIDSDVLIWFTRGHLGAVERLARIDAWQISVVTYLEVAQGCRNKDELHRIKLGSNTNTLQYCRYPPPSANKPRS